MKVVNLKGVATVMSSEIFQIPGTSPGWVTSGLTGTGKKLK
ncbi:hypothetical protein [Autumnicola edwardsiae]|uniref:Uncharacterized protein n=1 Tax=Autumnicola edwardsiae TaxID=3075594 RepID=A0ABU3CY11_9FLAO|nr:hypothetical protein [Zunongwangia sp. F297]MDT0651133.1 hypothetical protein [Zunongwangia sp. F297]